MNRNGSHPESPGPDRRTVDPLPTPTSSDSKLVRLDRLMTVLSRREQSHTPPGLSERVFRASAGYLPQSDVRRLRFPGRMTVRTPVIGQLAMAASVALVFVVAAWFLAPPAPPGPDAGDRSAMHQPPVAEILLPVVRPATFTVLSREAEEILLPTSEFDYLLETRGMTLADVTDDLAMLYEALSEL